MRYTNRNEAIDRLATYLQHNRAPILSVQLAAKLQLQPRELWDAVEALEARGQIAIERR